MTQFDGLCALAQAPVGELPSVQGITQQVVIVFNTRQHMLDIGEVYHGSLNTAQIRAAEVFKPAIQRNTAAIIIGHNHPSGDPTPSPEDVAVTCALVEAGKLLDIELLDHLICGAGDRFTSLKERGLGFS